MRACRMAALPRGFGWIPGCAGIGSWGPRLFLGLALISGIGFRLAAADPTTERLAYEAAVRAWEDGDFARVRSAMQAFLERHPSSPMAPGARDRLQLAESELAMTAGKPGEARVILERFVAQRADSELAPQAVLGLALSALRSGDPAMAVSALRASTGAARRLMDSKPPAALAFRALLVLAEAETRVGDPAAAESTLDRARSHVTGVADEWRRGLLLVEARKAAGRKEAAVEAARQLRRVAGQDSMAAQRPVANEILAGLLAAASPDEALKLWDENLGAGQLAATRRVAAVRSAGLLADLGRFDTAQERLSAWLGANRSDPEADPVRVTLAQLMVRRHLEATNQPVQTILADQLALLVQAGALFEQVLTNPPSSALHGVAWLGRGWCRWREFEAGVQPTNRLADAVLSFGRAAELLPSDSYEGQVAAAKLGEALRASGEPAAALERLETLLAAPWSERMSREYRIPVLSLATDCAARLGRLERVSALTDDLERVLEPRRFAEQVQAVAGLLAAGRRPAEARLYLAGRALRNGQEAVRAPLELAIAGMLFREGEWTEAVSAYDRWLARYPRHESAPTAEFERALAADRGGTATNSLVLLGGLAARHPTNALALKAQLLLAAHHFNAQDFVRAEEASVTILTNRGWAGRPDWHRARLLAARAAVEQRSAGGLLNARGYLTNLVSDAQCPAEILPEAYLVFGDMLQREYPDGSTNVWENFREAISAYAQVARLAPGSVLAAMAHHASGYCHLQLAAQNPATYPAAAEQFQRAFEHPAADVPLRSAAKWGLGQVAEKLQRFEEARNHHLDVLYHAILRPGERQNDYWVRRCGLSAAALLEQQQSWEPAARVYDRLADLFPSARADFGQRAARARAYSPVGAGR